MRYSKSDFKMLAGQTVKLQVVEYGEDVSFKRVNYGYAAKTIKIKVVSFGEDVRIKEKSFFATFNAIIC